MKIDLKFPGGEFHLESQPMDRSRFESICGVVYALIIAWGIHGVLIAVLGH